MMTEDQLKICQEAQDLYGKVSVSYIMRKMHCTAAEAEDILLEWNKINMITKFKCKKCNQTKIENWFDKETSDNFICNECQTEKENEFKIIYKPINEEMKNHSKYLLVKTMLEGNQKIVNIYIDNEINKEDICYQIDHLWTWMPKNHRICLRCKKYE